jgi:hypothetical protein
MNARITVVAGILFASLSGLFLPAPARAEVVVLKCGDSTIDVDLSAKIVLYAPEGFPQRKAAADVTARSVEFSIPYEPYTKVRIDRVTMEYSTWLPQRGWAAGGFGGGFGREGRTCQRVTGGF